MRNLRKTPSLIYLTRREVSENPFSFWAGERVAIKSPVAHIIATPRPYVKNYLIIFKSFVYNYLGRFRARPLDFVKC